jgi:hypothetical protein
MNSHAVYEAKGNSSASPEIATFQYWQQDKFLTLNNGQARHYASQHGNGLALPML